MAIADGEFRRLLGAVEKAKSRLCFSLMYACGLRSREAVGMPIERTDGDRRILRIVGKGDKERLVPLPASLLGPMRAFWATHRNRTWLFPAQRGGGPMALKYVRIGFRRACAEADLPRIVTPHSLRHGYATRLLEANVSIRISGTMRQPPYYRNCRAERHWSSCRTSRNSFIARASIPAPATRAAIPLSCRGPALSLY